MTNPGDDLNRFDIGLPQGSNGPEDNSAIPVDKSASPGSKNAAKGPGKAPGKGNSPAEPIKEPSKTVVKGLSVGNSQDPLAEPIKEPLTAARSNNARSNNTRSINKGSSAPTAPATPADESETEVVRKKSGFWHAAPSWAISTVVHVAAILALAAWNIEPITKEISLMLNVGEPVGSESDALEEFSMDDSTAEMQTESEDIPSDVPNVEPTAVDAKVEMDMSSLVAEAPAVSMSSLSDSLAPASSLAAQSSAAMRASLNSRSKETKRELLKKFGGTTETERAVSMALKWLAEHQNPQTGAWTFAHPLVCGGKCDRPGERGPSMNAATGMALMCFLGAGQTHMEGEYKETVFKGLSFLIQSMKVQGGFGAWWVGDGHSKKLDDMYSHGIASIAMCEAYGMTRDPRLLEAAQLSINYMTLAQNPQTGGWHYSPFPEGKMPGDTSVVGWQMMAIKSAAMSGLNYDIDTVRKANFFLDTMMVPGGFGYHYALESKKSNPTDYRPAMTACGVLCRMYSGWTKEEPSIKAAVAKFVESGPIAGDSYFNYYATQVLKQYGGAEWESWNEKMKGLLIGSQVQTGHGAGSWHFEEGISSQAGGRLYCTCMATMMLEVYYRYMPLYAEQAEEDAFQL